MKHKNSFESLTLREEEVIRASLSGLPDKIVARKLGMALTTIRAHWRTIRLKTGLSSRMEVTDSYRRWQVALAGACIDLGFGSACLGGASNDARELLSYLSPDHEPLANAVLRETKPLYRTDLDAFERTFLRCVRAAKGEAVPTDNGERPRCICPTHCEQCMVKSLLVRGTPLAEEILSRFCPDVAWFLKCSMKTGEIACAWAAASPDYQCEVRLKTDRIWHWFFDRLKSRGSCMVPTVRLLPEAAVEEFRGLRELNLSSCYFFTLGTSPEGLAGLAFLGYIHTTILSRDHLTPFMAESGRPCKGDDLTFLNDLPTPASGGAPTPSAGSAKRTEAPHRGGSTPARWEYPASPSP